MKACKNEHCDTSEGDGVEASGYCFTCAEELACLLAAEGLNPEIAWGKAADPVPPTRHECAECHAVLQPLSSGIVHYCESREN